MIHYNYQEKLKTAWTKAVDTYSEGHRNLSSYFNEEETAFLQSIGLSVQEVYDFAVDFVESGEPDFTTFALIHDIRRSYHSEVQKSSTVRKRVEANSYPSPDDSYRGISYLPRITNKAQTKLTGELNPDIMYSCGNDRRFLKTYDIHPAEFLRKVWETDADLEQLSTWIYDRNSSVLKVS